MFTKKNNLKLDANILREQKYTTNNFVIGYEEKKKLFCFKKRIKHKTIDQNSNILTISSNFENSRESDLTLLEQDILRGRGVFQFDNLNKDYYIDEVHSIANKYERIDDVIDFDLEKAEALFNENYINELINSKKIVVIKFPNLEHSSDDIKNRISKIYDIVFNVFIIYNDNQNQFPNTSIYINQLYYLKFNSLFNIKKMFDSINQESLFCRFSCFDLTWSSDNRKFLNAFLEENIDYCKIMMCYDPTETINYFNNGEYRMNLRDVKSLNNGEFFLAKGLKIEPVIFKSYSYYLKKF